MCEDDALIFFLSLLRFGSLPLQVCGLRAERGFVPVRVSLSCSRPLYVFR